jgi:ethanolamine permease
VIGIAAIYSDGLVNLQGMTLTAAMITMSVFGAIVMYIISMLSLFKLRKTEPNLERTFRAPGYPVVPAIALFLAVVCLVAMAWFNTLIGWCSSASWPPVICTSADRQATRRAPADAIEGI